MCFPGWVVLEVVDPLVDELLWAVECDGVFCELYGGVGLVCFWFAVWCGVVEDEVVVHWGDSFMGDFFCQVDVGRLDLSGLCLVSR